MKLSVSQTATIPATDASGKMELYLSFRSEAGKVLIELHSRNFDHGSRLALSASTEMSKEDWKKLNALMTLGE